MKIVYKTKAKNSGDFGQVIIDSKEVIGDDDQAKEFLNTLTAEQWKLIPSYLLCSVTAQNFNCYAKLTKV